MCDSPRGPRTLWLLLIAHGRVYLRGATLQLSKSVPFFGDLVLYVRKKAKLVEVPNSALPICVLFLIFDLLSVSIRQRMEKKSLNFVEKPNLRLFLKASPDSVCLLEGCQRKSRRG